MAAAASNNATQPIVIPPLTPEEEDHIVLARITLDERPLRRIIKKFHNYTMLSHPTIVPVLNSGSSSSTNLEDARDAFLLELASFQLLMKKSVMICEAEARQVEEYHRERERLDNEQEVLKCQIEELKVALENAQMLRRRKIEYDVLAERVNALPSREDSENAIEALENDLAAIRTEHETQDRIMIGQKVALEGIIAELSALRFMGKEPETPASVPPSNRETPVLEITELPTTDDSAASVAPDEIVEEEKLVRDSVTETASSEGVIEEENDIEMGEVEEDPREKNRKKSRDELEEGEATDASSELSEPPDD